MIRQVADNVTQWDCGRYFLFFAGDEILLKATNDADAAKEGAALLKEFNEYTTQDSK